jgi:hypothetical protein
MDEAIHRFLLLDQQKLLGICISFYLNIKRDNNYDFRNLNNKQLVEWIQLNYRWDEKTQTWKCILQEQSKIAA